MSQGFVRRPTLLVYHTVALYSAVGQSKKACFRWFYKGFLYSALRQNKNAHFTNVFNVFRNLLPFRVPIYRGGHDMSATLYNV